MGDINISGTLTAGGLAVPGYTTALTPVTAANPAAPATTVSTSAVMAGLAVAATPSTSGKLLVIISGVAGTQTGAVVCTVSARYGTGTAPTNGAAVTGTASPQGTVQCRAPAAATTPATPFTLMFVVSGLTIGTAYWFDLTYQTSNGADAAVLGSLSFAIIECQ